MQMLRWGDVEPGVLTRDDCVLTEVEVGAADGAGVVSRIND
jgi:hypothetical protein